MGTCTSPSETLNKHVRSRDKYRVAKPAPVEAICVGASQPLGVSDSEMEKGQSYSSGPWDARENGGLPGNGMVSRGETSAGVSRATL
jgi:hypothetical protein